MTVTRERLIETFSNPAFYPHPVEKVEKRETHISLVFLTGQYVYKIKKPVDFGFLDFTTLEKRKYCCEQEIHLNRRLTSDVYLDLLTLRKKGSNLVLGDTGEIVEYVIKMRQLSDEDTLAYLLRNDQLKRDHVSRLAGRLAEFYTSAARDSSIDAFGSVDTIEFNTEENFSQTRPFVPDIIPADRYDFIREATRGFLSSRKGLFERRIENGWIRDCHGDLRCEHVYFEDGDIQVIDCIEFNDRFRYGDVASDLAFLLMDLDFLGYGGTGNELVREYVNACYDPDFFTVLDFYKCYRAYVRLKVSCLQISGGTLKPDEELRVREEAGKYLELSYRAACCLRRPMLWLVCGLPASGKSRMAREISLRYQIPLFSSDVIRKELFGFRPEDRVDEDFGQGIYSPEASSKTYGKLLELADGSLKEGMSVVLDATFGKSEARDKAASIAAKRDASFVIVHCKPPLGTIERRLRAREGRKLVTDARLKHLEGHVKSFEKLRENELKKSIVVDTERKFEENVLKVFINSYFLRCPELVEETAC